MIPLIIYVIGCFAGYFLMKYLQERITEEARTYEGIITSFLLSWLTVIIVVIVLIVVKCSKLPSKPPKWL